MREWVLPGFCFKAEDGIRGHCVTGVQTCALPISVGRRRLEARDGRPRERRRIEIRGPILKAGAAHRERKVMRNAEFGTTSEIGRASCRERGSMLVRRAWLGQSALVVGSAAAAQLT